METVTHTYLGLDLGQRRDHSALAVVDAVRVNSFECDPVTRAFKSRETLRVVHLARFPLGTPYTGLPAKVKRALAGQTTPASLAIDAGGPGLPVVDIFRHAKTGVSILPAMITASGTTARPVNGVYSIARNTLLTLLRVGLETGKCRIANDLALKSEFVDELAGMGDDGSEHDDMVFAVALAVWAATIRAPAFYRSAA
jgi:hypothetical protein